MLIKAVTLTLLSAVAYSATAEERVKSLNDSMHTHLTIAVIDDDKWKFNSSVNAYTVNYEITYVRRGYALEASDAKLRQSLAHEAGHVACRCQSESEANYRARFFSK